MNVAIIKRLSLKFLVRYKTRIGQMIISDKRVPRVPDKKPEKYTPIRNSRKPNSLFFLVELCQSAKQNNDIPIIQKEKGMGFPENKLSLSA